MIYLPCLILGILPSFIWLFYFLKEDVHPEPKKEILKVFFFGMIIALFAGFLEISFSKGISLLSLKGEIIFFLNLFIGIAFIEEYLKYYVVKKIVFSSPEFDEPLDVPLYMITGALGFAALENIIILSSFAFSVQIPFLKSILRLATLSYLRFMGATFLHALSSGIFGIFLAFSFLKTKMRKEYTLMGLISAVLLHAFYNFSIIKIESFLRFIIIAFSFLFTVLFLFFSFKKLKKIKSICKIN